MVPTKELVSTKRSAVGGIESARPPAMAMPLNIVENCTATHNLTLLTTAIAHLSEAIVITDAFATIQFVNPAFTRITGYNPGDVVGRNIRLLKSDRQNPAYYQELWKTILSGKVWHGELINRRKDGTFYSGRMSITPFHDLTSVVTNFIAIQQDATEPGAAEDHLHRGKKRREEVHQIATLGGWELDESASEFRGSAGFFEIFGLPPSTVTVPFGEAMNALPNEDRERVEKVLKNTLHTHEPFDVEHRVVRDDSTVRLVRSRGQAVADHDGGAVRLVGTSHDITDFRLAHEKLRQSEEKFRSLVANLPVVIWSATVDAQTQYVSPNVELIFGFTPAEIFEKGAELWFGRIHPTEVKFIVEAYEQLFATGQPFDVEYRLQRKDGRWIWVHDRSYRTYERDGVRYADGILSDVTDRKQAEDALRKSIATSDRALKDLADQKFALDRHAIVAVTDVQGTITYVNDKFCAISQYSRDELIGRNHRILNSGHHPKEFFQKMYQTIAKGNVWHEEIKNRAKDGSIYWVDTTVVPFVGEDGKVSQYIAIRADVTERKLADERLHKAKEAAEDANRAKSQFLANMSHEIRTPMNGVIGVAGLLLDTELTPEQRQYAEIVRSSGEALLNVINDILDFSKIEARKLTLETTDFNLRTVLEDAAAVLATKASEKGLALTRELEPQTPCLLRGDPGRVRQVLLNLLGNAVKFTAKGTVTTKVRLVADDKSTVTLHFAVTDTGIGFRQDRATALFEPFVQADGSSTRRYGGTGLGLTISKQLVEMMRGHIGVESEEGKGSTFWFTAVFEKQPQLSVPAASGKSGTAFPDHGRSIPSAPAALRDARILLAEDNPTNQQVAVAILRKLGYRADLVTNGKEALRALGEADYDIVLMDCEMPEMDGFAAARLIRQAHTTVRNPLLPIVAITAGALTGDREKCLQAGMSDYLAKPIEPRQLAEILEKWLTPSAKSSNVIPAGGQLRARSEPVFDEKEMLARLMGDKDLVGKILAAFLSDAPGQFSTLRKRLEKGDTEGARLQAHTLKGAAATVSAKALLSLCRALQDTVTASGLGSALALIPRLEEEFELLKSTLKQSGWV